MFVTKELRIIITYFSIIGIEVDIPSHILLDIAQLEAVRIADLLWGEYSIQLRQ